jgi:hypothetical protein
MSKLAGKPPEWTVVDRFGIAAVDALPISLPKFGGLVKFIKRAATTGVEFVKELAIAYYRPARPPAPAEVFAGRRWWR